MVLEKLSHFSHTHSLQLVIELVEVADLLRIVARVSVLIEQVSPQLCVLLHVQHHCFFVSFFFLIQVNQFDLWLQDFLHELSLLVSRTIFVYQSLHIVIKTHLSLANTQLNLPLLKLFSEPLLLSFRVQAFTFLFQPFLFLHLKFAFLDLLYLLQCSHIPDSISRSSSSIRQHCHGVSAALML